MNPFAFPGPAPGEPLPKVDMPLCPWDIPEHKALYADIDRAEEAYGEFKERVSKPQWLARYGLFVLVTGSEGCGKTSLVNRCTTWLRDQIKAANGTCNIIDLTDSGTPNAIPLPQRQQQTSNQLFDAISTGGLVDPPVLERLEQYIPEPANFYRFLSNSLSDSNGRVLIILLPPSELTEEVMAYSQLATKKIVLFAESSSGVVGAAGLSDSAQVEHLHLTVGPLREGDGRRFVQHRMNSKLHDGKGKCRPLNPEAPETMIARRREAGNDTSIRQLQKLLHGLYNELDKKGDYADTKVEYKDLSDYSLYSLRRLM